MSPISVNLKIIVNEKVFVKDPETSVLGKKIIQESVVLIQEKGFEDFNFKKLGQRIGSNESSIYRYFESKHKLLIYLSSWYWGWMEYRLDSEINSILKPFEKLQKAITIITGKVKDDSTTLHINESILNKIIIVEFTKTILTKEVDQENKEGLFLIYKRVINRIAALIFEVNPEYAYAKSLASSIIEGSLHQHFLTDHLTTITDCDANHSVSDFYLDLISKTLKK